ncbi:MAG: shikimate dehydrogenase [Muribaculaceae bacterium]|nr:shikimate dehydrogenase [Muribaculaceae bacterium]
MAIKELYGLVGYPLGHSFSESFFNNKFNSEGIDAQYLNFEIPSIGDFKTVINNNSNLHGLNITIPYKEQVIPFLDDIDTNATEIGAVNVIKFIRNGNKLILKGFNSDVIGFCNSLKPLLKPHHTHALVLGTGGAAKAITYGLKSLGIEPTYVSRTKQEGIFTYDELTPEIMGKHQVIVNTTPTGMYPHVDTCPNIPYQLLTPKHLCYDVVYNPEVTLFMKKSQEHGAVVKNGLEMLILQALAAWEIWNK